MEDTKKDLAKEYSEYLKADIHDELSSLEDSIDDMLTRLEEFESLMEGVHLGGTSSLVTTVPEVQQSCKALEGLFSRVDHIESLVSRVRTDLAAVEAGLDAAEAETGPPAAELGLRSFLKPLFAKKPEGSASIMRSPCYEPPDIFKTAEFFPAPDSQS